MVGFERLDNEITQHCKKALSGMARVPAVRRKTKRGSHICN
jgi:hypothetical protein